MKLRICFLFFISTQIYPDSSNHFENLSLTQKIVLETKRIELDEFPHAFNPSIIKVEQGILMSFRYSPELTNPWLSYIGVVLLNESFQPISKPQLISTRSKTSRTQSQSEDARLFSYRGRIFLIYNDNMQVNHPSFADRRDMHVVELFFNDGLFSVSAPLKLMHFEKKNIVWQKNWVPFEWEKKLLISYSVNPHEILYANLLNGNCYKSYETTASLDWKFGILRESCPPQLVNGKYLTFFHSGMITASIASWGQDLWHYFMGAYTFSAKPPFELIEFTSNPIVGKGFYTSSSYEKRVIFPGGFIVDGSYIYLAYGKDDHEMWIAILDLLELEKSLTPISK